MKRITCIVLAVVIAAVFAVPSASALQAGSVEPSASLPYVDDVNDWGASRCILTVVASGDRAVLKATSGGKALKVKRHERNVWTVVVKKRAYVKLSVRAGNGRWKSIGYRVY